MKKKSKAKLKMSLCDLWRDLAENVEKAHFDYDNTQVKKMTSAQSWKGYSFYYQGQVIYFTSREVQLISHYLEHKTHKESAALQKLSVRTVESYARNIRRKLGCRRKNTVIQIIQHGEFSHWWSVTQLNRMMTC